MTAQQDPKLEARPKTYQSNGTNSTKPTTPIPHPLDQLSVAETDKARKHVIEARGSDTVLQFRSIYLEEPPKKELVPFLEAEHAGKITAQTPRPARVAKVLYDVVAKDKTHEYIESDIDLGTGKESIKRVVDKVHQSAMTM
jgi:primary-amine oxidase